MPQHAPLAISLETQVCTFLLGGYVWLLFSAAIYMLVTLSCSLCVNVTTQSLHWESKQAHLQKPYPLLHKLAPTQPALVTVMTPTARLPHGKQALLFCLS